MVQWERMAYDRQHTLHILLVMLTQHATTPHFHPISMGHVPLKPHQDFCPKHPKGSLHSANPGLLKDGDLVLL